MQVTIAKKSERNPGGNLSHRNTCRTPNENPWGNENEQKKQHVYSQNFPERHVSSSKIWCVFFLLSDFTYNFLSCTLVNCEHPARTKAYEPTTL